MRLFLLVCLLAVAGCGDGEPAEDGDVEDPRVRIENLELSLMPGGARIVSGRLHNTSDRRMDAVQIQIALYDADNRRIGKMHVLVRDIEPNESQPFREPVDQDVDAHGARALSVLVR